MNLLADENFPGFAVRFLRGLGHSVEWIAETAPGASDVGVLEMAIRRPAVILTLDKDLGELAVRSGLPESCGVILMRVAESSPEHFLARLAAAFSQEIPWKGHVTVIGRDRIRTRPVS